MPNGEIVKSPFVRKYPAADYENNGPLESKDNLYICENAAAPTYLNSSGSFRLSRILPIVVKSLCTVTCDLKPLRPFTRKLGRRGYYYEVEFDLGMIFGPELVFRLVHDGRVMGSAVAKYA